MDAAFIFLHQTIRQLLSLFYFNIVQGNDEVAELHKVVEMQRKDLNDLIDPEVTSKYDEGHGPNEKMTSGQMLLAGFSGLFAKFETEFSTLFEAFKKLQLSSLFSNIELNQQQAFQVTCLVLMFFVWQFQFQLFLLCFVSCTQFKYLFSAQGFKCAPFEFVYNGFILLFPIEAFVHAHPQIF